MNKGAEGLSLPVEKLRDAIRDNYTSPDFDLEKSIRDLPFHYDYMRKLFKKEMGVSPLEFMTELRMRRAGELLSKVQTRTTSIAEIAEACGFNDPLYFSRVFKKHYNCPPTQFLRDLYASRYS